MRRSIRIPASNLLRNSQRRRHVPIIALSASAAPFAAAPLSQIEGIHSARFFSANQIESELPSRSLVEPESNEERTRSEAREIIDRLCQSNAPEQAEQVLRTMEEQDLYLHSTEYLKVLKCYIHLHQVEQAHQLLLTMQQTPCRDCFPLVAEALIEKNKLSKAKELLYNHMDRGIARTDFFNTVISAYVHQNRRRQAVALIHKMDDYARQEHPEARPDKMTMTTIMQQLASRGHSRDAKALLERMWNSPDAKMQPDAVTYSQVLYAHANAPDVDANGAHQLLQTMKERFHTHGNPSNRPNTVVYNSFLSVLANAGDGERAEQVLREMEAARDLRPDAISYGTVLTAWKNVSRGDKAEELLWRIPNPDRVCFSITIAALARQGHAKRAEAILRYMVAQNLEPNTGTYTAVLNAWANAKDDPDGFENAKRVLQEMGEQRGIVIDRAVYHTFLKAIENSFMLDNKAPSVRSVLLRMKRSADSRPSNITYRQAILAVAATRGDSETQKKALQFAVQIYQDRKNLPPKEQTDTRIHGTMLEACGKLSPHGLHGDEVVEQVFLTCCQEGIVTSRHVMQLERAASEELLKKIFNTDKVDRKMFQSYPKSWSRKRRGKGQHGRRRK